MPECKNKKHKFIDQMKIGILFAMNDAGEMKMLKYIKTSCILLTLVGSSVVMGQDAQPQKIQKPWYENLEFSGFVDVYYMYNLNNREGRNPDTTGGLNTYNKQFQVAAMELDIERAATPESPWGFRIDMQNGANNPYQEAPYNASSGTINMNLLQQAYVSFYLKFLGGMTVDVGKMATHIGYEVIESKDNINYNVGYIFFNTVPFINTGARANVSLSENWSMGLFLYNSAGGTGSDIAAYNMGKNGYGDNNTRRKAVGTQLTGSLIPDFLDVTWNTLYGIDGTTGRYGNGEVIAAELAGQSLLPREPGKKDYWLINNLILQINPTPKLYIALDYTQGEKSGAAGNAFNGAPVTVPDLSNPVTLTRDDSNARFTYRTYGLWMKYKFTETFALGLRYEKIDDSRNGGAMGTSGRIGPNERLDLTQPNALSGGVIRPGFIGGAQTFTITPTYIWEENIIIKLDLRRDQAQGSQFINEKGQPAGYQNGATLGIVAKF